MGHGLWRVSVADIWAISSALEAVYQKGISIDLAMYWLKLSYKGFPSTVLVTPAFSGCLPTAWWRSGYGNPINGRWQAHLASLVRPIGAPLGVAGLR